MWNWLTNVFECKIACIACRLNRALFSLECSSRIYIVNIYIYSADAAAATLFVLCARYTKLALVYLNGTAQSARERASQCTVYVCTIVQTANRCALHISGWSRFLTVSDKRREKTSIPHASRNERDVFVRVRYTHVELTQSHSQQRACDQRAKRTEGVTRKI